MIFTGIEAEGEPEDTVHGGAMWARMPITALVGDTPFEEWPEPMAVHDAQPLGLFFAYTCSLCN